MDRPHAGAHYSTRLTFDDQDGWTAVELYMSDESEARRVARVVFWDAMGQFVLDATSAELPLEIVEELFSEARDKIRVR
tara:strand:- start:2450 stop:2686 length:237 start_codon:yes stop_codon:yes gene_type:complete